MKPVPVFICCLFLWSCNDWNCSGTHSGNPATDTLVMVEAWKGIIHAVTCQDIEVKITFTRRPNTDTGTYRMTQHCEDNGNTFGEEGTWRIKRRKNEIEYELIGRNGGAARYYHVKDDRLMELDTDSKEVTSYYLEKVE